MYAVTEIFRTLQGEGSHAGAPAVFVRLANCNLSCPWCDTDFGVKETLDSSEINERIDELDPDQKCIVVITGGEPTLQIKDDDPIGGRRYKCLESNGTGLVPAWINHACISPKPQMKLKHFRANQVDDLKVVLDLENNEPEQWHELVLKRVVDGKIRTTSLRRRFYIQPLSMDLKSALDYVMENPHWRLSVQLHKMLEIE